MFFRKKHKRKIEREKYLSKVKLDFEEITDDILRAIIEIPGIMSKLPENFSIILAIQTLINYFKYKTSKPILDKNTWGKACGGEERIIEKCNQFIKNQKIAIEQMINNKELLVKNKILSNNEINYFGDLVNDYNKQITIYNINNILTHINNINVNVHEFNKTANSKYNKQILKFEYSVNPNNDDYIIINKQAFAVPNHKSYSEGNREFRRTFLFDDQNTNNSQFNIVRTQIIQDILNKDFDEAIKFYANNLQYLKDVKFIFINDKMKDYFEEIDSLKLKNLDISSCFVSDNLFFLDEKYFLFNIARLPQSSYIEKVICFDTNVVSYLIRNCKGQKKELPSSIYEVIKLTQKNRRWGIDLTPYFLENCLFSPTKLNSDEYKNNIITFETLFHETKEAVNYANNLILMEKQLLESPLGLYYKRLYKLYYFYLLVITDMQLNNKFSLQMKEKKLFEYFHNFGMLSKMELEVAKKFFIDKNNFGFFNKIQKNNNSLIDDLKNMAWDIFHINYIVNQHTIQTQNSIDFTLPTLLTYDKRLKEVFELYKLKALAFISFNPEKVFVNENSNLDEKLTQKYFSAKMYNERIEKIKNFTDKSLIELLEKLIIEFEQKLQN